MRYQRQELIPSWDQKKLENSSVVIIGAGALGNHIAPALLALGIGEIKIIDFDNVEEHNLNRQFMFTEHDIGKNKAEALVERLKERNSNASVIAVNEKVTDDNVDLLIGEPDVIVDAVDLIYVRKILSAYALEIDVPLVHGGLSWNGWEAAVLTRKTPCINCIYPKPVQDEEAEIITSCIEKPQASVVYTSQMCASMMVELIRRLLLPLDGDPPYEGIMYKYNAQMPVPMYIEHLERKENCDLCLPILKDIDKPAYEFAIKQINEIKKIEENIKENDIL